MNSSMNYEFPRVDLYLCIAKFCIQLIQFFVRNQTENKQNYFTFPRINQYKMVDKIGL